MSDFPPPPASVPPPPPTTGGTPSPIGVGKPLRVLFIVLAISQGLFLIAVVNRYSYVSDVKDGNSVFTSQRVDEVDGYVSAAGGVTVLLSLVVFVLLVMFLYRLVVHVRSHGGTLRHSNGMAIGGFFIPFANIFIPYRLFTDVTRFFREHKPEHRSAHVIFNWWWWTYVAGLFMLRFSSSTESDDIDSLLQSDGYLIIASALLTVATVCAAVAVRRLTNASRDVFV
jgi:heme/copper-type cytochrome/quinol oxidase subunit 2